MRGGDGVLGGGLVDDLGGGDGWRVGNRRGWVLVGRDIMM